MSVADFFSALGTGVKPTPTGGLSTVKPGQHPHSKVWSHSRSHLAMPFDAIGLTINEHGRITEVRRGSPAHDAHVDPGYVILSVNGKPAQNSKAQIVELATKSYEVTFSLFDCSAIDELVVAITAGANKATAEKALLGDDLDEDDFAPDDHTPKSLRPAAKTTSKIPMNPVTEEPEYEQLVKEDPDRYGFLSYQHPLNSHWKIRVEKAREDRALMRKLEEEIEAEVQQKDNEQHDAAMNALDALMDSDEEEDAEKAKKAAEEQKQKQQKETKRKARMVDEDAAPKPTAAAFDLGDENPPADGVSPTAPNPDLFSAILGEAAAGPPPPYSAVVGNTTTPPPPPDTMTLAQAMGIELPTSRPRTAEPEAAVQQESSSNEERCRKPDPPSTLPPIILKMLCSMQAPRRRREKSGKEPTADGEQSENYNKDKHLPDRPPAPQVCADFNRGRCHRSNCIYRHVEDPSKQRSNRHRDERTTDTSRGSHHHHNDHRRGGGDSSSTHNNHRDDSRGDPYAPRHRNKRSRSHDDTDDRRGRYREDSRDRHGRDRDRRRNDNDDEYRRSKRDRKESPHRHQRDGGDRKDDGRHRRNEEQSGSSPYHHDRHRSRTDDRRRDDRRY